MCSSMLRVSNIEEAFSFLTLRWCLCGYLEPIEQNVNGKNGVYELVYFVKDSKSLQRFKVAASQFDSFTKDKSDAAIERLVSYTHPRT